MARKTKSYKPIEGGFVAMTWKMLNSKAFKKLPKSSAKILPYFLGKVKDHRHPDDPARYTVQFSFTYSEAKQYGFGKSTFFKMLGDLVRFGFIDVIKKGGLRSQGGQADSLFRLSRRWEAYGMAYYHDGNWMRYYPDRESVLKMNPTSPENDQLDVVR
jgi:hypothetical protein